MNAQPLTSSTEEPPSAASADVDQRRRARAARRPVARRPVSLFAGPPRPARHATRPDDAEIARRALEVIRWVTTLPEGSVRIGVRDGWITLEGRVDALSMRVAAEEAVCKLEGIAGVRNLLDVRPVPGSQSAADHQRRLRDPLAHRDFRKVLPRGGARLRARRGASPEPS